MEEEPDVLSMDLLLLPLPLVFFVGVKWAGVLKAPSLVELLVFDFFLECSSVFTSSSRIRSPICLRRRFMRSSFWPAMPSFEILSPFLRERRVD